jgi:transcriptional regulator with XRE-family HTH domain
MAKKFRNLVTRMSPEAQARATARAQGMLLEMQLQELRKTKNITQIELAQVMQVEQAAISKIERREDLHLSTLRQYIKALGGELKLVASFPEGDIQVQPFGTSSLPSS